MGEVRTVPLQGGPLDGVDKRLHPRMETEFPVVCPCHLAFARYRPDGTWVGTRCTAVDGDEDGPLEAEETHHE